MLLHAVTQSVGTKSDLARINDLQQWGMSIFLGLVSVAATIAVAFFTWKLTAATERMAELQREMVKLQKVLGEKQGQLSELQGLLAKADLVPDIAVSLATTPKTGVRITNLGKYGIEVLALYHTDDPGFIPSDSSQPYTPKPEDEQFPIGLPAGLFVTIVNAYPPTDKSIVAILFRDRNSTMIGRWRFTKERGLRFFERLGDYDRLR